MLAYRSTYQKALKEGRLVNPRVCSDCGKKSKDTHGHHPDHSKPLKVIWLCRKCHKRHHRENNIVAPGPHSKPQKETRKTIRLSDYHTSEQVSKILGVSRARVSRLIIEGIIAGIKAGGKFWLIEKKSLAEYVAALKRVKGESK